MDAMTPKQDIVNAYLGSHPSGTDVASLLKEFLRQCNIETCLRAVAIAGSEGGASVRPTQLALVVRYLLEADQGGSPGSRTPTTGDIQACCDMASSIMGSPNSAWGVTVSDNAWSMVHRIVYQQFPDRDQSGYVPRSLAIYRQIAPTLVEKCGFDFEQGYLEAYGMGVDDAWSIGYALFRWCQANPGVRFQPESLLDILDTDGSDLEMFQRFLAVYSCDYEMYRSMLGAPRPDQTHFEPYNLNPLRKSPILTLPGGDHIVPVPEYLLRRITHGLYYDLIPLDRPGYIDLIGRSFEAYTGELWAVLECDSVGWLEDGQWVVSNDETAVVIEGVTRPFGALSRATGDRAHLRGDLARRGGVVDAVVRLQEIQRSIQTGPALGGRRFIGVIAALEDFYLANGRFIRGAVDEELIDRVRPPMDSSIQMSHINGLESASAFAASSQISLAGLIRQKVDRPEYASLEMDAYIRHQALLSGDRTEIDLVPSVLKRAASNFLS